MRKLLYVFTSFLLAGGCSTAAAPSEGPVLQPSFHVVDEPMEAPAGYTRVDVVHLMPTPHGVAVVLSDEDRVRILPIIVGATEGLAISYRMDGRSYPRPLTHDLFDEVIRSLSARIVKVQIDRVEGGTYYGSVFVEGPDGVIEFDARPSDAIALALGNDLPIFCHKQVLEDAGMTAEDLEDMEEDPGPFEEDHPPDDETL